MKKLILLLTFSSLMAAAGFAQSSQNADNQTVNPPTSYYVLIETPYGNMKAKLYNETPQHRDNFIKLVREGFYNDLLFHRVINRFMIQGGDPNSKGAKPGEMLGNGTLGYRVPAEFNAALFHKKGALAAARDNNPQKASSSCQFYIVQGQPWNEVALQRFGKNYTAEQIDAYKTLGGNPHLDMEYTVFGEVVEGLEVIDKIAAVQTGPMDRPMEDVWMKISIIEN